MVGLLREPPIRRLRGPLVDGTPRHVDRGERAAGDRGAEAEEERRQALLHAKAHSHRTDAVTSIGLTMGGEHRTQCLAVPVLLERPHREERRHLVVTVCGSHQQVAEVADGVVLDVVHVADAAQRGGVERLASELAEVDAVERDRR